MNREVRFRAWDNSRKIMIDSDMIYINKESDSGTASLFTTISNLQEHYELMLCTGLKDKKGRNVYHKDKLKGHGKVWLVEWQTEEARFLLLPTIGNNMSWKFMDEVSRMEIIGNVYENAELLSKRT